MSGRSCSAEINLICPILFSFEWRQTDQEVVVSLLVKNVTPEKLEVDIQRREVLGYLFMNHA